MSSTTTEKPNGPLATGDNVAITTLGKEYLEPATDIIAHIFRDDAVITFLLSSLPEGERQAYIPKWFKIVFSSAMIGGGFFQRVGANGDCVALWLPPGKKVDGMVNLLRAGVIGMMFKVGLEGMQRLTSDLESKKDALKQDLFGNGPMLYHYLFFIGTKEEARGRGLASRVIKEHQKKVLEGDRLPIWLESSSEHSRDLYLRCGFTLVGEIEAGQGTHAASGRKEKGGPGIVTYAMVWWPDKASKGKDSTV